MPFCKAKLLPQNSTHRICCYHGKALKWSSKMENSETWLSNLLVKSKYSSSLLMHICNLFIKIYSVISSLLYILQVMMLASHNSSFTYRRFKGTVAKIDCIIRFRERVKIIIKTKLILVQKTFSALKFPLKTFFSF